MSLMRKDRSGLKQVRGRGERAGRGWRESKTADKIITMRGPFTFAEEQRVWATRE